MLPVRRTLLFSVIVLSHSVAIAESITAYTPAPDTLRTVSVHAKRRLRDTGLMITTMDSAVLHESISRSMADILMQNSTAFVKSYGRATESTVELRGTSPAHTQVLWNGMRINSPILGTLDFSTIPSSFIDRANILHGASSIPLTGGGLGGAVDMATQPRMERGIAGQYTQGIGSYGTWDEYLRADWTGERWSSTTRLGLGRSDNDFKYVNRDKMVDERNEEGDIVRSYHPTERNKSGYFRDLHALEDLRYHDERGNEIGASLWYTRTKRGLPFLSVDYKDDNQFKNEQVFQTLRSVLSWNHTGSGWSTGAKAGLTAQDMAYDYYTTRQEQRTDITHSHSWTQSAFLQARADWMPQRIWLLSAVADGYLNHVKSWDRSPYHIGQNYNRTRGEGSLSLQARWRPIDPLTIAAVFREEVVGTTVASPIPALYADWLLCRSWGLTFRTSIARNNRHPSMDDLYFQPGGNPELAPEHGFTYDGGLQINRTWHRFSLCAQATAFDSHIRDWIQWLPNAKGYWEPDNVKRVHNYGVESQLQLGLDLPYTWKIQISGNFAWTPSLNVGDGINDNDESRGKQLCYVPRRSANLMCRLGWRSWSLTYRWVHYSERYTTTSNQADQITGRLLPYYMSDLSARKDFQFKHVGVSLRFEVNNLLNTEYITVLSRPMAPRHYAFYLEIRPEWNKN